MVTEKSILTHCAVFLWSWVNEEICPSKSRTLVELEQQREIIFSLFLLITPGTVLIMCLPGRRSEYAKYCVMCSDLTLNDSAWGFKFV